MRVGAERNRAAALIFLFGLIFGPPLVARADSILEPMMQVQDPQIEYHDGWFNLELSDGCNVRLPNWTQRLR